MRECGETRVTARKRVNERSTSFKGVKLKAPIRPRGGYPETRGGYVEMRYMICCGNAKKKLGRMACYPELQKEDLLRYSKIYMGKEIK